MQIDPYGSGTSASHWFGVYQAYSCSSTLFLIESTSTMGMSEYEQTGEERQKVLRLSTSDFFDVLQTTDFTDQGILGRGLELWSVDLNPDELTSLLATEQSRYRLMEQSDGLYSIVKDEASVRKTEQGVDRSHESLSFGWHTDGLYYPQVPSVAILYCKSPGKADIRTVFADTRPILQQMKREGLLESLEMIDMVYTGKDGREHPRSFVETHSHTGEKVANVGSRVYIRQKQAFINDISLEEMAFVVNYFYTLANGSIVEHPWQEGDTVVLDNEGLIHGRVNEDEVVDTERELVRFWLEPKMTPA